MPVPRSVKVLAKSARGVLPLSVVSTSVVRAVCRATGTTPRSLALHLHRHGPVSSRLPNGRTLRLWSRADDGISNTVFWYGVEGYEPETLPLFYQLATEARVVFDVGAHVGLFSLVAAHANPRGTVYAFEAMEPTARRFGENVARNGLENVHVLSAVVGEAAGTAVFYHDGTEFQSGCSRLPGDKPHEIQLPMISLDDFAAERSLPAADLLKIDVEGAELQVFQGMRGLLERHHPHLLCEVLRHRWPGRATGLEELLGPYGYRYYHLTPEGPRPAPEIEGQTDFLNYLFSTRPEDQVRAAWEQGSAAFAGLSGA